MRINFAYLKKLDELTITLTSSGVTSGGARSGRPMGMKHGILKHGIPQGRGSKCQFWELEPPPSHA